MLIEPILFYLKLRKDLEAFGFKVNPYYPCVANNMIQDKQMTIIWHANDPTVSHADKDIVDSFVQWNRETYENITKLNTSRGKYIII